jgi:hypothetical protein
MLQLGQIASTRAPRSIGSGKNERRKDLANQSDPDAKITKMKDGRTHLAHKAEHAGDLD